MTDDEKHEWARRLADKIIEKTGGELPIGVWALFWEEQRARRLRRKRFETSRHWAGFGVRNCNARR